MRSWYVAKTKVRQERPTAAVLAGRGFGVYLPELGVWRRGAGHRPELRREPLFPGYVFVQLDLATAELVCARSAPGVGYFVGADGVPTPLADELVEAIRERAAARCRDRSPARFAAGERVVFTRGPLAGLEAVFDGTLSGAGRAQVLLQVLNRPVRVAAHVADLRRAG